MLFYIVLFLLCICGISIADSRKAKWIFAILCAVFAFRDEAGIDDNSYIKAFDYILKGWKFDIEFSYMMLVKFVNILGLNYKALFLIYAVFSFFFLYKGVMIFFKTRYSRTLFIASFFGIAFCTSLSVMRQYLASCICFYAIALLYQKNSWIKPIIYCLIATFFHMGAIISLPILFLFSRRIRISDITKIIVLTVCVVGGYANIAGAVFNGILRYLPVSYQLYGGALAGSFSSAGGIVSLTLALMYYVQEVIAFIDKKKKKQNLSYMNECNEVLEKGQLIYLSILFVFVHAGVSSRLALTYLPLVTTLPYTFSLRITKHQRRYIQLALIGMMFLLYIIALKTVSANNSGYFIPYKASFHFWQNQL